MDSSASNFSHDCAVLVPFGNAAQEGENLKDGDRFRLFKI